ncbi:hydantoinase/oxoprolinase family protein [Acuticoccus kandeliae]|uniref:hydantoinase/oxoprolinase family protein n=1 Tax=Acuticoccus kandeliae TaxID=2073160 RepID=UPI0014742657|nr:hydantoinase/oxoprolinase family protein [Acuticoccus kandeliae]
MDILASPCRVGADIGGTFTDLVLLAEDGTIVRRKVASTTDDYSRGIVEGLRDALGETGGEASIVKEVLHGTTVATNAILEYKGARCGLIATRGFRDILELRRLRMPQLYRLDWNKPAELIERQMRAEVTERIAADGSVVTPLAREEVLAVTASLLERGAESIAVAFINSYANPAHEIEVGKIIAEAYPDLPVSLSSAILPEIQEYERTSTAAVNAYVQPTVRRYLTNLRASLNDAGVVSPLLIMQSNGGLISSRGAGAMPVRIIESGPAAGVIASREIARLCGYQNLICFDMGGTTAKASLLEEGRLQESGEYEVGGGVSVGSRLNRGGGYVIRVPSIDIAEVGAGGGSLVSFDAAGGLKVGPESAGSYPGPVCYGNGNTQPTVTDANVTLGYVSPGGLAGGSLKIDADASREAIAARVGAVIGAELGDAALGVHTIANASMIRALRSVTIERGRDPSDFAMCAFGGNGPIHGPHIARELGIKQVIVPPCPGIFSAFGLLLADVEHHYIKSVRQPLEAMNAEAFAARFADMEEQARIGASDPEYPLGEYSLQRSVVLRFVGQSFGFAVDLPEGPITEAEIARLPARHLQEYSRTYGFESPGEKLEVESLKLVARGAAAASDKWLTAAAGTEIDHAAPPTTRMAYFGGKWGWRDTPVMTRSGLTDAPLAGPAIIEGYDSTAIVPPDCTAELDRFGNIIINVAVLDA